MIFNFYHVRYVNLCSLKTCWDVLIFIYVTTIYSISTTSMKQNDCILNWIGFSHIIKFSKRKIYQKEWKVFNFVGINNLYLFFSFFELFEKLGIYWSTCN